MIDANPMIAGSLAAPLEAKADGRTKPFGQRHDMAACAGTR